MNRIFWKAMGEFFRKFATMQAGIYEEDGLTVSWEKMLFTTDKYRIIVLTEEVVENLEELIQRAVEEENYELAVKLRDKLARIKKESKKPPNDGTISE